MASLRPLLDPRRAQGSVPILDSGGGSSFRLTARVATYPEIRISNQKYMGIPRNVQAILLVHKSLYKSLCVAVPGNDNHIILWRIDDRLNQNRETV